MIAWEPKFALGVEVMDRQHQRLIELANELAARMGSAATGDEIAACVRALTDYTARHFWMEERLMADTGYERSGLHGEQHQALLRELERLGEQMLRGAGTRRGMKALGFLRDWVTHHIQLSDRDFAKHLISRGIL